MLSSMVMAGLHESEANFITSAMVKELDFIVNIQVIGIHVKF